MSSDERIEITAMNTSPVVAPAGLFTVMTAPMSAPSWDSERKSGAATRTPGGSAP